MRKFHLLIILVLGGVIAGGSWFGYRLWRRQQDRALARQGLSALPDLSRWSPEFAARVQAATARVGQAAYPAEPLGELARLYDANGFLTEATRALRALRQLEPTNARWAYYLADLRLKEKDEAEARQLLIETVRLAPDYAPAMVVLGELLVREKRLDEARPYLQSAVNLGVKDPRAAAGLAFIEGTRGQRKEAIRRLEEAAQVYPRYAPLHGMLAELLAHAGDRAGAARQRELEQGAQATFTATDPWLDDLGGACYDSYRLELLASPHLAAGNYEHTLPFLTRAVQLSPTDATFHDLLSQAYQALGRLAEAQTALEEGIKRAPQAFALHVRLAVILCLAQRPLEAVAATRRALVQWPEEAELHAALGYSLSAAHRPEEAVAAFRAALARNRKLPEAHLILGNCLLELGQPAEAKASYEEALLYRPDYPEGLSALTGLAIRFGDAKTASANGEKLFALMPNQPATRRLYAGVQLLKANVAASAGRMEEAEENFRRGIAVDPTLGLLHAGLGMVFVTRKQFDAAIPEFERYAEVAPEDTDAYMMLGQALLDAGRPADARKAFDRGRAVARQTRDTERAAQFERLLAP